MGHCLRYFFLKNGMAAKTRDPNLLKVLLHLQHHEDSQQRRVEAQELDPQLALLRTWQTGRLEQTYPDLLGNAKTGPACRFILSDIYAARDFSQRDHDIEHLYRLLSKFLPEHMLKLLVYAIEMKQLTYQLDQAQVHALVEKLGVTDTITPEHYAEAYRICDNYAERERQIELVVEIIEEICLGLRWPFTGPTLRLARIPAEAAGWFEFYDFLERGYQAMYPMRARKDEQAFIRTIHKREMQILDRIFAGHPDPFHID